MALGTTAICRVLPPAPDDEDSVEAAAALAAPHAADPAAAEPAAVEPCPHAAASARSADSATAPAAVLPLLDMVDVDMFSLFLSCMDDGATWRVPRPAERDHDR